MRGAPIPQFKTGALPSPHGVVAAGAPVDPDFASSRLLVGIGAAATPKAVDLFAWHRSRVQKANNCVSHAKCAMLQVMMAIRAGRPLTDAEMVSVNYSYGGAQQLYSPGSFPDTGSTCALTLKWWREHGLVLEQDYPESTDTATQLPPDDLIQRGAGATLTGSHRIADTEDAPDLMCATLNLAEQGICSPPNIVVTADTKMTSVARDGIIDAPGGSVVGGHSLAVLSWHPELGDAGCFGVADTWGLYRWYVTRDYVVKYTHEKYVLEAAPAGTVK